MANEISRREGLKALAGFGVAMQVASAQATGPQYIPDGKGGGQVTNKGFTYTLTSKGDYKEDNTITSNGTQMHIVAEGKVIPGPNGQGYQIDGSTLKVTATDASGKPAPSTPNTDPENIRKRGNAVLKFAQSKGYAPQLPAPAPTNAPAPEAPTAQTQPGTDPNAPTVEWKDNTTAIVTFADKRTVEFNRSYGDSVIVQEPKLGTQTVIQYTNATQPHMSRISVDPIGADKSRPPAQYAYFDAAGRYDEDGKSRNDLLPPKKNANRDPYYDPPEKFKQDSQATMQTAMDARTALMNDPRAKAMRWNEKSFPGFEDYGAKAPAPTTPAPSAPKAQGGPKP